MDDELKVFLQLQPSAFHQFNTLKQLKLPWASIRIYFTFLPIVFLGGNSNVPASEITLRILRREIKHSDDNALCTGVHEIQSQNTFRSLYQ